MFTKLSLLMPGRNKDKYPMIRVSQEVYQKLWDLKYEFRVDTLREVIEKLLEEYEKHREE